MAHGLGEFQGLLCCDFHFEAIRVVRGLVPDLPQLDAVRVRDTVLAAQSVGGIVAVVHPRGRVFGGAGTDLALGRDSPELAPVGFEVHHEERIGADAPAEVHELLRAHLVVVEPAPELVEHGLALARRPDAFLPAVIGAEATAPAHQRRHQFLRDLDYVFPPGVRREIPGGIHGTVRHAQRLHELQVQIGRKVMLGPGSHHQRVCSGRVLFSRWSRFLARGDSGRCQA